jgi:hypothetical protein
MSIRTEPAVIAGLVQAILALAVSFGLSLTPEQIGSILAVTAAILALVVRQQVYPAVKIEEGIDDDHAGIAG